MGNELVGLPQTSRQKSSKAWICGASASTTRLVVAGCFSLGISAAVMASAGAYGSRLGAPTFWPWILTALQVLALWAAGRSHWWGWLLGASVQMPWIAYAVVTEQIGFIPGCIVSSLVQTYSFIESLPDPESGSDGVPPHHRGAVRRRVRPAV